uniref:Macro domain-containing protein n=1 Tax=Odontella aurita TaxID=265563 RepID=A0A7S4MVC6_9STRA|mmetsp:Transcript_35079/g.104682  ORF Transcript_35079/g.104682 Transcript_35079/m.104682 type:complete len:153 (+) Transcript_35079:61-519(+)
MNSAVHHIERAVATSPGWGSELSKEYECVVHTVPPFYHHSPDVNPEEGLSSCYKEALPLGFREGAKKAGLLHVSDVIRVASPLIGAGCRGFPGRVAIKVAAEESVRWRDNEGAGGEVLAFGIPDRVIADELVNEIEQEDRKRRKALRETNSF